MQEDMQEEDELSLLDYRTPKGQLIKLLDQKIKKPEIDDTLGQVLDQFSQLTNEQTAFLNNGIFNMNFAEDALLLQSCGQYYAKRVDKLWDELLQFHTRMVKYDETTAKNCTDSNKREARKLEIAKLEERLNRGKRKKIVLTEPDNDKEVRPTNGCFIFDIDQSNCSDLFNNLIYPFPDESEIVIEEQPVEPFEDNTELLDEWRAIRHIDDEENRRNCDSVLVAQYHRLRYRFKHYSTPSSADMIYDLSDPEEFNTREGRLISYHHIKHLFDYNDRCLLPDEDFFVANLRIAFYLKKKWLIKNHINPDNPYETYKEDWEKYERDFLANEKRKIHNMPQSNPEELMRFYKALAKKEQIAIQKVEKLRKEGVQNLPIISFETVIVAPVKEGYEGIFDPYIPEDFELPPPVVDISEETHPLEGDHEAELSTLLADASKLPDPNSKNPLEKPRSDSGYFDGGFADDESDHEDQPEGAKTGSDTPFEFDKENTDNKENETSHDGATTIDPEITNNEGVQVPHQSDQRETGEIESVNNALDINANEQSASPVELQEDPANTADNPFGTTCEPQLNESAESIEISRTVPTEPDINKEEMKNAIKEFAKCATADQDLVYTALKNSYFNQTEDMITIVYEKPEGDESDIESIHGDQVMVFGYFYKEDELAVTKRGLKVLANNNKRDDVKNNKGDEVQESKKRKPILEDYPLAKRRKLSQRQIQTLKRSLIEPVKELKWENFFSLNYQSETGEGEITRVEYESDVEDEDLLDDDDANDTDSVSENNDGCNEIVLSQDSGINVDITVNETVEEPQNAQELSEPQPSEPQTSEFQPDAPISTERYELTDLSKIDLLADISKTTGISREQLQMEEDQPEATKLTPYEQEREKVRERVAEWKEHIMPKLKKLDEHDFDIHEYGAKIMDGLTTNEPKPFGELVTGKSSAEVVRFFISSLQLANTMNVDICGAKKGELSNDTFKLKLLNKERYHEHFQEYQAPSEESLRERLKKVKELRMQNKANKKQTTNKRKPSDEEEYQPQTTPKIRKPSTKTYSKPAGGSASPRKITVLNCNIINSTRQQTIDRSSTSRKHLKFDLQQPSTTPSSEQSVEPIGSSQHFDFQQPSTSTQADVWDQQGTFESVISDMPQPSTRASIDSGFMPSCDEDFLEQFDQLQQISNGPLGSTPEKPRKLLKIKLVRISKPN